MNVLVLGAGGMAGHLIALYLREQGWAVDTLSATNPLDSKTHLIDVTDQKRLTNFLTNRHYDAVINCIALLVKPSEEHKDLAVYLNSYLPHFLATFYKDNKTKVIQIGSDGIFSGEHAPYAEDALPDGTSFYGRTKALGELDNDKDLTFRLSITGPDTRPNAPGLFNWFLTQPKGSEISGYTNVMWSGVTTLEIAKAIKAAIEQNLTGVYHLTPKDTISKFDLLQLLQAVFDRKDVTITPSTGSAVGTTLTSKRHDFKYQVPDYKTMIEDLKTWIHTRQKLYNHYER